MRSFDTNSTNLFWEVIELKSREFSRGRSRNKKALLAEGLIHCDGSGYQLQVGQRPQIAVSVETPAPTGDTVEVAGWRPRNFANSSRIEEKLEACPRATEPPFAGAAIDIVGPRAITARTTATARNFVVRFIVASSPVSR
jgi:hypothetical protein